MAEITKKEKLKDILEKLNSGEKNQEIKKEARELLEDLGAKELSEAEQELIEAGLPETELRHLCQAHIEIMEEELKELKTEVEAGHPLYTLIAEHDKILEILEKLDDINDEIQELESYEESNIIFSELKNLGSKLLETEKHHEREEEALFPAVNDTGVTGPTRIMRMEHEDLWPHKVEIDKLARDIDNMDFDKFKEKLNQEVEYVALTMRDHIFKENNILYPTAQEVIADEIWEDIKEKSDIIGYCSFTPLDL